MIYSAKIMGYIGQKPWDILSKTMGYIGQKQWIYWVKLWDILGKIYDILTKTGIYQKKDILSKKYGIYWAKIMGYFG